MSTEFTAADYMCSTMIDAIKGEETVSLGVNSLLPMVSIFTARKLGWKGHVFTIANSIDPTPPELPEQTMGREMMTGTPYVIDNLMMYDLIASRRVSFMFLGAAQIGQDGSLNSSWVTKSDGRTIRLGGGGGASFITSMISRYGVWRTKHTREIFVPKTDFTTAKGGLELVVTPLCVFRMEEGQLRLWSVNPTSTFEEVADNTGFELAWHSGAVRSTPDPRPEVQAAWTTIDPKELRAREVVVHAR